uniref:WD_REPEATS_REGION domain-containing protein n=1 Tax=Caenorhabditis tropicalis TaxID=1561998 RepID=A0A1I7UA09_9PELO
MKRVQSELFAPYRFMGVVTGDVAPSLRTTFVGKKSTLSVLCPIDNVIVQYNGMKLRAIGMSEPLNDKVTTVASSSTSVFAAHGKTISSLHFCREVKNSIDIGENIKFMYLMGTQLIAIDTSSGIHVIDTPDDQFQKSLHMEGSESFEISSICHPSTYLNKIVLGSSQGRLRIVNIRSGKVIHEFQRDFGARITVLEQTTALDVLAIGMENGEIVLFNVKMDKVLGTYRHDSRITSIAFRNDGEASMVTADATGTMAVWDLEKQELLGKITGTHTNEINCLHFIPGEPIMLSASLDNSIRLWIFDGADGMPRELIRLEGHSKPCVSVKFVGKNEVLSAGKDGSVRKYDVTSLTMRQKLGTVAQLPKGTAITAATEVRNVEEMVFGWQREAAWNNVFCRQKDDTKVTTWQSRNNTHGGFSLQHDRFKKKVDFIDAKATALCLSPCGNFVFIGYSTGHIDQFNAQSGRHVHSYTSTAPKTKKREAKRRTPAKSFIKSNGSLLNDTPAADSPITSLSVDQLGRDLMSTDEEGHILFWNLATKQVTARMFKKDVRLGISAPCPCNSLVAVVAIDEEGAESVIVVDRVCHRVARAFKTVGKKVNAMAFSPNGEWLLVADNDSYIRVFDVINSQLIDVLLFSKPCISMEFNETGQYLATVHQGERAVYSWFNKTLLAQQVNIRVLDPEYLPKWADEDKEDVDVIDIDSDSDDGTTVLDLEVRKMKNMQIDPSLITFSGLPASRWANLPDLALIKERNKPTDAPKKIKQAPFFLSAAATLDGFEFQTDSIEELLGSVSNTSKRNLLELETGFSKLLKNATTKEHLLNGFEEFKEKSLSGIDYEIRNLNPKTLPIFIRMLNEVRTSWIPYST